MPVTMHYLAMHVRIRRILRGNSFHPSSRDIRVESHFPVMMLKVLCDQEAGDWRFTKPSLFWKSSDPLQLRDSTKGFIVYYVKLQSLPACRARLAYCVSDFCNSTVIPDSIVSGRLTIYSCEKYAEPRPLCCCITQTYCSSSFLLFLSLYLCFFSK